MDVRRNADDCLLGLPPREFRLNISSISRLGPMYSMFIFNDALRMSGMCN
jgi:hypothetical protein